MNRVNNKLKFLKIRIFFLKHKTMVGHEEDHFFRFADDRFDIVLKT